jgi:hypothetical protein
MDECGNRPDKQCASQRSEGLQKSGKATLAANVAWCAARKGHLEETVKDEEGCC